MCFHSVTSQRSTGVFDKSDDRNPWKAHTVLHINYCSGDGHVGNTSHFYCNAGEDNKSCPEYKQKGYLNARAAIDWIKAQMDKSLSSLIVSGSSAGAIGTHLWANTLFAEFSIDGRSYAHGAAIVDSYVGLAPEGVVPQIILSFGLCDTGLLTDHLKTACEDGGDISKLTVQTVFEEAMAAYPSNAFALINSKTDAVQNVYYKASAIAFGKPEAALLKPQQYYRLVNSVLERYNKYQNFIAYLVEGSQHTFLPANLCDFYEAGVKGKDAGSPAGIPMMYTWVRQLTLDQAEVAVSMECYGPGLEKAVWGKRTFEDVAYCDNALLPKVLKDHAVNKMLGSHKADIETYA